ncbi:MAG: UDP-glucose/GDP-mannose dehydrogenase family protein [Deltaproteobacteria bacterium]|nr:UDP-glucose/GDP-mannose dehydrogenase family protein [Deltaproteobacteria bacterium]
MKLCVIGTGYVGLVTGTCFAEMGNDVVCVDIDEEKIEKLRRKEVPIFEPGLQELLERNVNEGRLTFTTDLAEGVERSLLLFIAVGTPEGEDGSADLQHVLAVARSIGQVMEAYRIVVIKSTVPVGTAEKVRDAIRTELDARGLDDLEFDVVSNPEFLKEGNAVQDCLKPDRIIVGTDNVRTAEILKELYAPFTRTNHPILVMDIRSAEMTKYASNAMLATKISFINEIANICERVGADVAAVRLGMGADSRIGYQFLFPGVGYGGSCFPKDVKALIQTAKKAGYDARVLEAVDSVNARQKHVLADKILEWFRAEGIDPAGATVAVWGLSFKPNTDDMREAPSLTVIGRLREAGCRIRAYDPVAEESARRILGEDGIVYCASNYEAVEGVDCLAVCTEWGAFRRPDFERVKGLMRRPAVFDGRNIYEPAKMRKMGFAYFGIGRQGG